LLHPDFIGVRNDVPVAVIVRSEIPRLVIARDKVPKQSLKRLETGWSSRLRSPCSCPDLSGQRRQSKLCYYKSTTNRNKNQKMRAIILAAGASRRLYPLTDGMPKCMLKIGNKTIMEKQLEMLRGYGIDDIVVVRGYKKEKIQYSHIRYYENPGYKENGILSSLFYAEDELDDIFIFSYSDILYERSILEKLLKSEADISLVVDVDWTGQYVNRDKHPVSEAELVVVENDRIAKIGKGLEPSEAHGEFIGLAMFSEEGARTLKLHYHKLLEEFQNKKDKEFQNATSFEKAYLTDMLQELIDQGCAISNLDINGGWSEIDTDEDLERAVKKWTKWKWGK